MSRSLIDRLMRRVDTLEAERKLAQRERRVFGMIVENHMESGAEIARFQADNGVTDAGLIIARVIIPYERRPGETAQEGVLAGKGAPRAKGVGILVRLRTPERRQLRISRRGVPF